MDLTAIFLNSWSHFAGLNEALQIKTKKPDNSSAYSPCQRCNYVTGKSMFNEMKGRWNVEPCMATSQEKDTNSLCTAIST